MSGSLRDELLKNGFQAKAPPPRKRGGGRKPSSRKSAPAGPDEELDLARAYALRARTEAAEREQAKREAERKKREKQERKRKLRALLDGQELNREDADQMRHYEFHGKIRRVHVTADQLAAINAGELGVVQSGGRAIVVKADVARQAAQVEPGVLALLVDPDQADDADDGVPDDLVW